MTPETYLAKANRALASARLLLTDGDLEGACNRAYYAMFDATQAALLSHHAPVNPAETRTHRGLISAFGLHLVKPGLIAVELGRMLESGRADSSALRLHRGSHRTGQSRMGRGEGDTICADDGAENLKRLGG